MDQKPIESVPTDGTRVLVYNRFFGWYVTVVQVRLNGNLYPMMGVHEKDGSVPGIWFPEPTHWTHLPDPPE